MARTRFVPGPLAGTSTFYDQAPTKIFHGPFTESLNLAVSSGHYGYPDFPSDRDVGGTFLLAGRRVNFGTVDVGKIFRYGDARWYYEGTVCAQPLIPNPLPIVTGEDYGSEAYRKMKPTKPSFAGLNAVYELRDLPGMLRQRFHDNDLKNLGSFYLGWKFGWESLIRDIRNLYEAQQGIEKRLKQLLRDNGKPVRRRVELASSSSVSTPVTGIANNLTSPVFVDQFYLSGSGAFRHTDIQRSGSRVWASAQFRYWLPGGPRDVGWDRRMKAALYGLEPSPAVIYNMIPWTWLIDWFGDLGGMLENMDAGVADRLAADYFYVMREDWAEGERNIHGAFFTSDKVAPNHTYKWVDSTTRAWSFTKTRIAGDPFGFRTELPLSAAQLAIAGALGLSRIR